MIEYPQEKTMNPSRRTFFFLAAIWLVAIILMSIVVFKDPLPHDIYWYCIMLFGGAVLCTYDVSTRRRWDETDREFGKKLRWPKVICTVACVASLITSFFI